MNNPINRLLADNKGRGLFSIANVENEATIYLYDIIVDDSSWGGVSAIDFVRELAAVTAGIIHLRINSPGGDVFSAQAMAQAIREHSARIIAHIDGVAASSASWLALAADEVTIAEGGMIMIHQAMTLAAGNASDLHAVAALLEKVDGILVDTYVKATGQTADQIAEWMAAETWFTAQEAVDAGFAGSIAHAAPKNVKAWNLSAYAHPPKSTSSAGLGNEMTPDLAIRQGMIYEAMENIVEEIGQFDQTFGKDGAHYMASSPFAGEGLQCANCSFYSGARSCELVAGDVSPEAICKLWIIPDRLISQPAASSSPANTEHLRRRLRLAEAQSA